MLIGTRLEDKEFTRRLSDSDQAQIMPGAYGRVLRDDEWVWMCCTPNGLVGDLSAHEVVENADGTITVNPSIEAQGGKTIVADDDGEAFERTGLMGFWHGYLVNGIWKEC
jgi:hypothetical protein